MRRRNVKNTPKFTIGKEAKRIITPISYLSLSILTSVAALIFLFTVPKYFYYRFFLAATRYNGPNPCPIPEGSYVDTCTAIDSKPIIISDNIQCNFSAICDTGTGKKYGRYDKSQHAFGQYGDRCPSGVLVYQEIILPSYMQFRGLENSRGFVRSELYRATQTKELYTYMVPQPNIEIDIFNTRDTTNIEDKDCKIRQQLSAANIVNPTLAATTITALTTYKLLN